MKKNLFSQRMEGIEKTLIREIHDKADPSCVDLGLGQPSFSTPSAILNHLKKNINDWNLGYSPNAGFPELREVIAENSGLDVSSEQVCVTVGAEEALFSILMVTLDPGDEVLIPDPGFPAYESLVKIAGGTPRKYPLRRENNFSLTHEDIVKAVTPETKVVLINSPNNPTAAVYSQQELKKLAGFMEDQDVWVISDEVYRELYYEEKPASVAPYLSRCVVINSLSKTFSMTGWRLGWCIGPSDLIQLMVKFNQLAVICAPVVSQKAGIFALKGLADKEKEENLKELHRRRETALRCMDEWTDLDYITPRGTFYLFVDVRDRMEKYGGSLDMCLKLLSEEKLVTIPGVAFGRGGEGYLRLSFAAPPPSIEEGIRRLSRFFK
ncbi:pyridoxal phosphate-dependent aminotransferase [bacterium]|nr:pyridoxal phosphate-dependent aminotransferase [bacterium]